VGLTIQRNLGPVSHLSPRQYTVETASGKPAICCPGCGEVSEIDVGGAHRVLTGGMLSPIWSCPYATCPLIEFIYLDDFDEPVVPA
jgi:hypothetical protein